MDPKLIDAIEDCLRFYDPQALISIGAPPDEYRHEAELIAEGFEALQTKFAIQQKVCEVFAEQFAPCKPIPFEWFDAIAVDLYNLEITKAR